LASRTSGLRAFALALLVAVVGISAQAAPVAATDPAPSDVPSDAPSPTPSDTPVAAPSPTPSDTPVLPAPEFVTPDPSATPDIASVVAPSAAASRPNYAARVVRIALAQRGDRYVRGATGPNAFDCSGLVRYSYRKAGVGAKLGGGNSARGMLRWARIRGLTGKRNPHIGDIVIYGNGSHAAIYIGHGRVVHALNPRLDIRVTRLHAMRTPFTTFIHMDRRLRG
jgi:cell wall-associated NlpC family hydrolase